MSKIDPTTYQSKFKTPDGDHQLIDVRTPEEFASGHIEGAVNIPVDSLTQRMSEVSKDKPIVVYCRSGNRSAQAALVLEMLGFQNVKNLEGGMVEWKNLS